MTGDVGVKYVTGCVALCLPDLSPDAPAALILDGHGSRFTLEFLTYCRSIGIIVVLRPPHTTHVLQGEDVTHFRFFKSAYHQAKMLRLSDKILRGSCRLTSADLIAAAKIPWQEAFSQKRCLDAWASIGVSPFTQKVYWDLKAAEEKAASAVAAASVNPELVTIQGMVGVMFGMNGGAAPAAASEATASQCDAFTGTALPAHQRRHKRAPALNSADLWDLPGGTTGDDCFRIVQAKTAEKAEKVVASKVKKAKRAAQATERLGGAVARGSHVISLLSHDEHLEALTVREMLDVLAFKGVSSLLSMHKRNTVKEILREILQLPCSGVPAPFPSRSERIPPAQCVASSSIAPLLTLVASAECDNHVNSDASSASDEQESDDFFE